MIAEREILGRTPHHERPAVNLAGLHQLTGNQPLEDLTVFDGLGLQFSTDIKHRTDEFRPVITLTVANFG